MIQYQIIQLFFKFDFETKFALRTFRNRHGRTHILIMFTKSRYLDAFGSVEILIVKIVVKITLPLHNDSLRRNCLHILENRFTFDFVSRRTLR